MMNRLLFRRARLLDPESGLDECGDLLVEGPALPDSRLMMR